MSDSVHPATVKLDMSRLYRVLLGEAETLRVELVGVGGTGSALALALGRLAYHLQRKGTRVEMTFVDPDTVEDRNIGRQFFCPAEVGANKAESMAIRLNAALGPDIRAVPTAFDHRMLVERWQLRQYAPESLKTCLVIGAVDNHNARRELARAVKAAQGNLWCLDLGNARHNGQILIGNLADPRRVQDIQLSDLGLCSGLPSPYLQAPELLEADVETPAISCADLVVVEEQSLMVNQAVAAFAAQYLYQFLVARELASYATAFTLSPPTASTKQITEANLATTWREIQGRQSQAPQASAASALEFR